MMKAFLLVICLVVLSRAAEQDGLPFTEFTYEYRVIEKLVNLTNEIKSLKDAKLAQDAVIDAQNKAVQKLKRRWENKDSSVYTVWGRKECPPNATETVYSGSAAGKYSSSKGSGTNYLCLPNNPTWGEYQLGAQSQALLYGAEYQSSYGHLKNVISHEVPCAVCRSERASKLMIPGRTNCTDSSWTMEYNGYLMAAYYNHYATEYICVHGTAEYVNTGGNRKADTSADLYHVEARSGALNGTTYPQERELACVICTK